MLAVVIAAFAPVKLEVSDAMFDACIPALAVNVVILPCNDEMLLVILTVFTVATIPPTVTPLCIYRALVSVLTISSPGAPT